MSLQFASNENVTLTGNTLLNASAWSICFWFRVPSQADSPHVFLKDQGDQFDRHVAVTVRSNNDGFFNPSSFTIQYRADNSNTIETTADFDDDVWHRALVVRRASDDHEVFIDGASEGSDASDWSTNSGQSTTTYIGTNENGDNPCLGDLARFAVWVGTALTVEQAETFLWRGIYPEQPDYWAEMDTTSVRDLSGSGVSFTVTGTTLTDHAPCGAPAGLI